MRGCHCILGANQVYFLLSVFLNGNKDVDESLLFCAASFWLLYQVCTEDGWISYAMFSVHFRGTADCRLTLTLLTKCWTSYRKTKIFTFHPSKLFQYENNFQVFSLLSTDNILLVLFLGSAHPNNNNNTEKNVHRGSSLWKFSMKNNLINEELSKMKKKPLHS